MVKQLQVARHPHSVESPGTRDQLSLESLLGSEGKRFFVFSDPFLFWRCSTIPSIRRNAFCYSLRISNSKRLRPIRLLTLICTSVLS